MKKDRAEILKQETVAKEETANAPKVTTPEAFAKPATWMSPSAASKAPSSKDLEAQGFNRR